MGGRLIKYKLFFLGAYKGDRFPTAAPPVPNTMESPAYKAAVQSTFPNSVAALLYKNFPGSSGSPLLTADQYAPATCAAATPGCDPANAVPSTVVPIGTPIYSGWLCPSNNSPAIAGNLQTLLG